MAELAELVKQEEQKQLIDKLPTRLVKILNLIKESFYRLVNSNYTIKETYKVFPNYFHCFFLRKTSRL